MTDMPSDTAFASKTFTRRIVVPMATMLIVAIGVVLGFVIFSAAGQNRLEVDSSTKLAKTALAVNQRQMARNLRDYAVWEDVYNNLHQRLDFDWASTDGNIGANIYEGLGYEMALVVDPRGEITYSVMEGTAREGASPGLVPAGLDEIVAASRRQATPVVSLLQSDSGILMVAATAILPPSIDRASVQAEELSTLIFVKSLNEAFLSRMGEEYLLEDLHIVAATPADGTAAIALSGPEGEPLGYLHWSPETPGYELLRLLLPPLGGATLILAVFAAVVVWNARNSTQALQDSARTVESYAHTLAESESRFRHVAEASSDWIWECDPDLRLIFLSARFSEVTGVSAATVLGKPLQQFFYSDSEHADWDLVRDGLDKKASFRDLRCFYRDRSGARRICRLAGRPILDPQKGFIGYRGTATDITEEVEAQARAKHLALHDSLTGLPNRVYFRERLSQALDGGRREARQVSVLCLDLDHFKEVNDTLGHAFGDMLLVAVAERLRGCVRSGDTVARLGGDEFAIIQTGGPGAEDAASLSMRIIDDITRPFLIEGQELHIGVSVGAALPEGPAEDTDRLLKCADIALYRAKNSGRGMVRFFEATMDRELQERKVLEQELRHALARDEFTMHYQPLFDLRSEHVVGVEALLRWTHPEHGVVSPDVFIPIAEKCGLIGLIGEWVLRSACSDAMQWDDLSVAVNLSPVHFRSRDLVDTVKQILRETGLPARRLELEVTESVLIKDTEAALEILEELRWLGVHIAMDDFGTGYSSLGYLNSFPFDKIKIDRSFISSGDDARKTEAIVRSIIILGESLQMTVTAEGVETWEQASFLIKEGCEQVQGYYFGKPMNFADMTKFLSEWKDFSSIDPRHAAA